MEKKDDIIGEFTLFYEKWKIIETDEIRNKKFIYGETDWMENTIKIKRGLSKDIKRLTLYHELFHIIFSNGSYKECCNDEPLVEWSAKCLDELNKCGIISIYDYDK